MTKIEEYILDKVRDHLGPAQLETVIVYLDQDLKHTGEQVSFGNVNVTLPWEGYIVFVDLDPKANWGHACSYFVIGQDSHEFLEIAAEMPPFLKAEASSFNLLNRGQLAPEWAVVTKPE